jgi:gluconate 2-dehydrogenase gamma chain
MEQSLSRRRFLRRSALLLGSACLALPLVDVQAGVRQASASMASNRRWQILAPGEVQDLEAIADQIWPADDSPGASALGAVRFIDAALDGFMAEILPLVRSGLQDLQQRAADMRPPSVRFSQLAPEQQTAALTAVEQTPFFSAVHMMVLLGLFALPDYGGNRDQGGWAQLGFESRHLWQPPFGYYDAQQEEERDGRA